MLHNRENMILDDYGYIGYSERELIAELRKNINAPIDQCFLLGPTRYNDAIEVNYSDLPKMKIFEECDRSKSIIAFHTNLASQWTIPEEYANFDITKWLLAQCNNEAELQRINEELSLFADKNLLLFLCYLKYMVDNFRKHKIVLGLGRGSSVASFVLYKLGVHKVNSLEYELDIHEFLK